MGRKAQRKDERRRVSSEAEEDDNNTKAQEQASSFKDLDFAQRRALQRQQAAEKRRAKQKCYLCGQAGHVRRECPGIADDGRGMSRYKGKSDVTQEQQKYQNARNNNHNKTTAHNRVSLESLGVDYPKEFSKLHDDNNNLNYYYDVNCDIPAAIDYLRSGRGQSKLSQLEAVEEYQAAATHAVDRSHLKGMISRSYLLKPHRP